MGCPNSAPKLPLPFNDKRPHLIHLSLNRPHSLSQMASGANQPFCHSTLSDQRTNRPTDAIGHRSTPLVLTLYW